MSAFLSYLLFTEIDRTAEIAQNRINIRLKILKLIILFRTDDDDDDVIYEDGEEIDTVYEEEDDGELKLHFSFL